MIDQRNLDLLNIIGGNFKRVASTGGGEYHGPCPLCGGKDRFVVQPNADNGGRWLCRGCHPNWSDAIGWIAHRDKLDLTKPEGMKSALQALSLNIQQLPTGNIVPASKSILTDADRPYASLTDDWQQKALQFIESSEISLWSDIGRDALQYLRKRGLQDDIIKSARLGFNPKGYSDKWAQVSVFAPRSIVIPWFNGEMPCGIRFKPAKGHYFWVRGSVGSMLYGIDDLRGQYRVVLVESEFCRLVIHSQAADLLRERKLIPVATGGTSGARSLKWLLHLSVAERVYIALDNDPAGDKASEWWLDKLPNAIRLRPTLKDPGDMHQARVSLSNWLSEVE